MALMSSKSPRRVRRTSSHSFARFVGRTVVPAAGIAFALWGAVVMSGLAATGPTTASVASASAALVRLPLPPATAEAPETRSSEKAGRPHPVLTGKADRATLVPPAQTSAKCQTVCDTANPPAAVKRKLDWSEVFAGRQDAAFATEPSRQARFAGSRLRTR